MLVMSEQLTADAFTSVAYDCVADTPGCDDTHSSNRIRPLNQLRKMQGK